MNSHQKTNTSDPMKKTASIVALIAGFTFAPTIVLLCTWCATLGQAFSLPDAAKGDIFSGVSALFAGIGTICALVAVGNHAFDKPNTPQQ